MFTGSTRYEVSVILPFGDDEDVIGSAVLATAAHLRALGLAFEILAVDEDSGDNSHAVLALMRAGVPELRVIHAAARGRGMEAGSARAQGRILWLVDAVAAVPPLDAFDRPWQRIVADEVDAVIVDGRFAVVHRVRALAVLAGLRGSSAAFLKRLGRRATTHGLRVDVGTGAGSPARPGSSAQRPWARLRDAVLAARHPRRSTDSDLA